VLLEEGKGRKILCGGQKGMEKRVCRYYRNASSSLTKKRREQSTILSRVRKNLTAYWEALHKKRARASPRSKGKLFSHQAEERSSSPGRKVRRTRKKILAYGRKWYRFGEGKEKTPCSTLREISGAGSWRGRRGYYQRKRRKRN